MQSAHPFSPSRAISAVYPSSATKVTAVASLAAQAISSNVFSDIPCLGTRHLPSYLTWISTTPLTCTLPSKPGATMLNPPWLRKETMQSAQASISASGASAL